MPPNGTLRAIDAAEDFAVDVNRYFGPLATRKRIRRKFGAQSDRLVQT
jgi:hypothetical protein